MIVAPPRPPAVQTDGVDVVNVTARPEVVVALTARGDWSIVWAPGLAKVIVWVAFVTLKVRVTEVAAV